MIGDFVRSLHVRQPSRVDTTSAGAHEQGRGPGSESGHSDSRRGRFRLIVNREPSAIAVLDSYLGRHRASG